jgi:RNA polymerase sigma factor (sigma-70 family)
MTMRGNRANAVLRYIGKLAATEEILNLADRELLKRFITRRDEAAFGVLVRRHGPMVLRLSLRILQNEQDAEDAFQATFLVLSRKAASLRRQESLGGWLYRVAYRLAQKARIAAARRRKHEGRVAVTQVAEPLSEITLREAHEVLDRELARLPDKFRVPLVLCYLEGLTRDEAAHRLGWSPSTLKGRLEQARERLQTRLVSRGLALWGALVASLLYEVTASAAVPSALLHSTVTTAAALAAGGAMASVVSNQVAALVAEGASMTIFFSKAKIATALLLAVSVAATAIGVVRHRAAAADQPALQQSQAAKPKAQQDQPSSATQPKPDVEATVEVRGQVLDPDGKPLAGAKLYLVKSTPEGPTHSQQATSGPDGRFSFAVPRSELDQGTAQKLPTQVMAVAQGHGCDWAPVGPAGNAGELTLRLVEDVPISGRIIDDDGKPVPGAKVQVQDLRAYPGESLKAELEDIRKGGFGTFPAKAWGGSLPGWSRVPMTGADGRFLLAGFGRERMVRLQIEGPFIQYTTIQVMARVSEPVPGPAPRRPVKIYGAGFDYLARAARPIHGAVREKTTGRAVAGVQIACNLTTHTAQTDNEGRYELLGCAKSEEYFINVRPGAGQPFFTVSVQFADTPGLTPLTADIELVRGIPLRGRLTDQTTGKAIAKARVDYRPLYPSPYGRNFDHGGASSSATTDPDGSFALVVLPGPGVIGATAFSREAYMPALITPKDMKDFFKDSKNWTDTGNSERMLLVAAGGPAMSLLAQVNYNVLALIEPSEKTEALKQDLELGPSRTLNGTVQGPDGKPLSGVAVYGLTPANAFVSQTLKTEAFAVMGLDLKRTRELLFYHPEKNLGFFKEIPGNEPEPLTISLQPCGSATGRVVDKDGQPLPGLALNFYRQGLRGPGGRDAKTDKDGRFRVEGLVPGQKYRLSPANLPGAQMHLEVLVVESAKTSDLGQITIDLSH